MSPDAEALVERVAHLERVSLVDQARRLAGWGRRPLAEEKIELTPLATAFDNRKVIGPHSHTGGVVVVISGTRRAEVNALMKTLGNTPQIHHPVLLIISDQRDAAYYRSLDPSGKDIRVVGTVSKYVTVESTVTSTLDNPPNSIRREFARIIEGARLIEDGLQTKHPKSGLDKIRARFQSRRRQSMNR